MDPLASIETGFQALRGTGSVGIRFGRWRAYAGLREVKDFDELVTLCRFAEASPRKDAALAGLCLAARRDDIAGIVLCWLLLPGLWEAVRQLPAEVLDPEDLAAELLAGLWTAAARIEEDTREVPGRLINGARWAAQRAMRDASSWNSRVTLKDVSLADGSVEIVFDEDLLARAVSEGVVTEGEVDLLLADRKEVGRIAHRLGVTVMVLKGRKRRARSRLIAWVQRASRDLLAREDRLTH
jgi:hypothetical protein